MWIKNMDEKSQRVQELILNSHSFCNKFLRLSSIRFLLQNCKHLIRYKSYLNNNFT